MRIVIIIITFPYSTCINSFLAAASLLLSSFKKMFFVLRKAVQRKTPFQASPKEKPDVGHLKFFGFLCYSHIVKYEQQKFDAKL